MLIWKKNYMIPLSTVFKIHMPVILKAEEIGKDLFSDGGVDSMENMFYSIECRLRDEIHKDAKPYRSWWNGITPDWKY